MKAIEKITKGLNEVANFSKSNVHYSTGETFRIAKQKESFKNEVNFLESNRIPAKIKSIFEGIDFQGNSTVINGQTLLVRSSTLRGKGRYITNGLVYFHDLQGNLIAQISIED